MSELEVFIFGLVFGVCTTILCMALSGTISDIWYNVRTHTKDNIEELVNDALDKFEERRGWKE